MVIFKKKPTTLSGYELHILKNNLYLMAINGNNNKLLLIDICCLLNKFGVYMWSQANKMQTIMFVCLYNRSLIKLISI